MELRQLLLLLFLVLLAVDSSLMFDLLSELSDSGSSGLTRELKSYLDVIVKATSSLEKSDRVVRRGIERLAGERCPGGKVVVVRISFSSMESLISTRRCGSSKNEVV